MLSGTKIAIKDERGITALFVAFLILPLFYLLFVFSSDVGNYYYVRRNNQRILDSAVLFGEKYLPYAEAAHSAVESYLKSQSVDEGSQIRVTATADGVTAEYLTHMPLTFAGLLGVEQQIPIYVKSSSFSTPLDVFLFVDTSSYMSPDLFNGQSWSENYSTQEDAMISSVFADYRYGVDDQIALPDLQVAAEQCQNPVFRQHKLAAIQTYEYLQGFGMNRLGLRFYPVSATEPDVRTLSYSTGSSSLELRRGDGQHIRNFDCQLLGQREEALTNDFDERRFVPPGVRVDIGSPEDEDALSMREVIWYQAARHQNVETDALLVSDIQTLSDTVAVKLLAEKDTLTKRGSLTAKAPKVAFIFAGDVPWSNGMRMIDSSGNVRASVRQEVVAALTTLKTHAVNANGSLSVFYILHAHRGNSSVLSSSGSTDDNVELALGITALQGVFAEVNALQVEGADDKEGDLELKLIASSDPSILVSDTAAYLGQIKKKALLSESASTGANSLTAGGGS